MKIEKVTVSIAGKLNLAQYESLDVFASMTGAPEGGESADQVIDELFRLCAEGITRQLAPIVAVNERTAERWARILAVAPRRLEIDFEKIEPIPYESKFDDVVKKEEKGKTGV